jgi:hypothetical protein
VIQIHAMASFRILHPTRTKKMPQPHFNIHLIDINTAMEEKKCRMGNKMRFSCQGMLGRLAPLSGRRLERTGLKGEFILDPYCFLNHSTLIFLRQLIALEE